MENTKPNNPSAFPQNNWSEIQDFEFRGMTLRDYFANSSMLGILNNGLKVDKSYAAEAFEYVAKCSYEIADAMLKQREL